MSVQETSDSPSFRPPNGVSSTTRGTVPLPQSDQVRAALQAEIATHDTILTTIRDCERQINSRSPSSDPAIRHLRQTLDRALHEASESKTRQSIMRMQLRVLAKIQRLEREITVFKLVVDRHSEAKNESFAMEFAASAQLFDSIARGASIIVRHAVSIYKRVVDQRAEIGRVCSRVWGKFVQTWMSNTKRIMISEMMKGGRRARGRIRWRIIEQGAHRCRANRLKFCVTLEEIRTLLVSLDGVR